MCVSVLVCVCSHFVSLEHSKHLKLKAKGQLLGVSREFNGCLKDVLRVFQEDSWCMALIHCRYPIRKSFFCNFCSSFMRNIEDREENTGKTRKWPTWYLSWFFFLFLYHHCIIDSVVYIKDKTYGQISLATVVTSSEWLHQLAFKVWFRLTQYQLSLNPLKSSSHKRVNRGRGMGTRGLFWPISILQIFLNTKS